MYNRTDFITIIIIIIIEKENLGKKKRKKEKGDEGEEEEEGWGLGDVVKKVGRDDRQRISNRPSFRPRNQRCDGSSFVFLTSSLLLFYIYLFIYTSTSQIIICQVSSNHFTLLYLSCSLSPPHTKLPSPPPPPPPLPLHHFNLTLPFLFFSFLFFFFSSPTSSTHFVFFFFCFPFFNMHISNSKSLPRFDHTKILYFIQSDLSITYVYVIYIYFNYLSN